MTSRRLAAITKRWFVWWLCQYPDPPIDGQFTAQLTVVACPVLHFRAETMRRRRRCHCSNDEDDVWSSSPFKPQMSAKIGVALMSISIQLSTWRTQSQQLPNLFEDHLNTQLLTVLNLKARPSNHTNFLWKQPEVLEVIYNHPGRYPCGFIRNFSESP